MDLASASVATSMPLYSAELPCRQSFSELVDEDDHLVAGFQRNGRIRQDHGVAGASRNWRYAEARSEKTWVNTIWPSSLKSKDS